MSAHAIDCLLVALQVPTASASNFQGDWHNGKLLEALIESLRPNTLDPSRDTRPVELTKHCMDKASMQCHVDLD